MARSRGDAAPVVVIVAAGGEPRLVREVHQADQVAGGDVEGVAGPAEHGGLQVPQVVDTGEHVVGIKVGRAVECARRGVAGGEPERRAGGGDGVEPGCGRPFCRSFRRSFGGQEGAVAAH